MARDMIECGVGALKDVVGGRLSRRVVLGAVSAIALAASGCGDKNNGADVESVTIPTVPVRPAPAPQDHDVMSGEWQKAHTNPGFKAPVGPYGNELKYFPPVEPSDMREADIFVRASRIQQILNQDADKYGCQVGVAHPNTELPLVIYTPVKGALRAIGVSYWPGDGSLHSDLDELPQGATYDRDYTGVFNGKPYKLEANYIPGGMANDLGNDLAFKIPNEVGHPGYLTDPCAAKIQG